MISISSLRARLVERTRRVDERPGYAAVLVPLLDVDGQLSLLLTRRTEKLSTHKGHVAFPGGRMDAGDDGPIGAALREANEEVGLPRAHVDVIGLLDDFPTVTDDMVVTPVIGWVEGAPELVANEYEVARIFTIPVQALMNRDAWVVRYWDKNGIDYPVFYFDWDGETLWGLSAYITLQFLTLLPDGPPIELPPPYGRGPIRGHPQAVSQD
ncbi:MAG: coenzyme A pyrophosphatase [Myxococcales bacterium]|nr:coenzyme A pyrophosphatase [Myxococcales bacterium]